MILKGFNNFFMLTLEISRLRPKIVFFGVDIFPPVSGSTDSHVCLSMIGIQGRIQDLSEWVLELFRKKNSDLGS